MSTITHAQLFLNSSVTGKIVYNLGVIVLVFVFMSVGMTVFAERPEGRTNAMNPVAHYLWQVTHHHEIEQLGNVVDYEYGRLYMFKRMKGYPSTWGWQEKDQYDRMYQEFVVNLERYNHLATQYNGDSSGSFEIKTYPRDYMPYATR